MASKKTKIDPQYVKAADLEAIPEATDGRDVVAEQRTKAIELDAVAEQERRDILEQRERNETERLEQQAEEARNRAERDQNLKSLENKPLTPRERERLAYLENIAQGKYPPKMPHPPAGMVPPQIMQELRILRLRAKVT